MIKAGKRIPIPNSHRGDLDWSLVSHLLKQAGINAEEWKRAGRQFHYHHGKTDWLH